MANSLDIIYTPDGAGKSVKFTVFRDRAPHALPPNIDVILIEAAVIPETREIQQSQAADGQKLANLLEGLIGYEYVELWCWTPAWAKLRETLGLHGEQRVAHWKRPVAAT